MNDTITAISTAVGNSGISIIRISGDEAFNIAGKLMKLTSTDVEKIKTHTIKYGHIYNETEIVDEVLVSFMKGPKTYTREDVVEINCHGGAFITKKVLETAIKAGATTINIPDTVGYRTPDEMYETIKYLKDNIKGIENIDISVHCHNDLGLAVANSIAAVEAGATQIECTVNGIGERAGNTSLEEVVMILKTRKDLFEGYTTNIDTKQIYPASKLVSLLTGVTTQPNKAIVGANAFSHESGIHQHGVLANPETYEIMKPETVGRNVDSLVLGKLSGKHAFIDKLNNLGLSGFDDKKIEQLFAEFKNLADRKKYVLDDDIISLVSGDAAEVVKGRLSLEQFEISRKDSKTKAEINILLDGEKEVSASYGSGPVDASYKAINRILNDNFVLEEYKLESITGDTDAQAQVVVIIEKNGKRYIGRAQSTDIVEASIKAYINALNRLYQD